LTCAYPKTQVEKKFYPHYISLISSNMARQLVKLVVTGEKFLISSKQEIQLVKLVVTEKNYLPNKTL